MAKVSLIVPIYNSSKYLKKCLDSLVNQTLKDIEIILINDGSTDDSEKLIKNYEDKRIKYILKKNEGIGKTRNRGIKEAAGNFIAFVDSDDYLDPHFCEYMYNNVDKLQKKMIKMHTRRKKKKSKNTYEGFLYVKDRLQKKTKQ